MTVYCQAMQTYLHPVGPSKLHQCKTPAHCLLCPTPPQAHSQTTSLLSVPTGQWESNIIIAKTCVVPLTQLFDTTM